MINSIKINPVGIVHFNKGIFSIHLEKEYIHAITNINGFKYLQVVWWGHKYDFPQKRTLLVIDKPYKTGPDQLGVFATRSEIRPNPILITNIQVLNIDYEKGIIYTPYIDADNGTAVLDIKPYHKIERIKDCSVPEWCMHWPDWYEEAANFNWQNEFNF